jgi:Ulp1 family protease
MGATANDVHAFTTQFYTKLEGEGVDAVSSWTAKKKLDIFEKKFIFIPVNKHIHWSLFVIVNPGKVENGHDSTIENDDEVLEHAFCIFMDSLRAHKKNHMRKIIQGWLNAEAKRLGKFKRLGQIEPFNPQSLPVVDPKGKGSNCVMVILCFFSFFLHSVVS